MSETKDGFTQSEVWIRKNECSRRDSNPGNELGRLRS